MKRLLVKPYRLFLYFLPSLILISILRVWFLSFDVVSGFDFVYYHRSFISEWFQTLSFLWTAAINFGTSFLPIANYFPYEWVIGFLAYLGFPYEIGVRFAFFYPILLLSLAGTVLFIKKAETKNFLPFLTGYILFFFNTFFYNIASWPNMMVAYALIPFVFTAFYFHLKEGKFFYFLLFVLFSFLTFVYEIRMMIVALLIAFSYFLFEFLTSKKQLRFLFGGILRCFFTGTAIFLLGAYVFFPIVHSFLSASSTSISDITGLPLFGTVFFRLEKSLTLAHPYWTGSTLEVFTLQPTPYYFWIFPIFAFSALFFVKKDKKILFFSLLALIGVFLGKGASSPFGFLYSWLYYHVPLFSLFREPVQWWGITAFSYSVLTAYLVKFTKEWLESKRAESGFLYSLMETFTIVLWIVLIFCIVLTAKPLITGEIGNQFVSRQVPVDDISLREFLSLDKRPSRILYVPDRHRFSYFDQTHPALTLASLSKDLKSLSPKLLSLEGVRYVILPNTFPDGVYKHFGLREAFERYINSFANREALSSDFIPIKNVQDLGEIRLWENLNPLYPMILSPEEVIYIEGRGAINDIIDLPAARSVSYYVPKIPPQEARAEIIEEINTLNQKALQVSTKIYAVAECIRCSVEQEYSKLVKFPYAKILPDSPLYRLVTWKENRFLESSKSSGQKLINTTFLAEKRTVELQKMLDKRVHRKYLIETLEKNNLLLSWIQSLLLNRDINAPIAKGELLTAYDYLSLQKRTLEDLTGSTQDGELKQLIKETGYRLDKIISEMQGEIWITEGDKKRLVVNLPEQGNYEIFAKTDEEEGLGETELLIDDKKTRKPEQQQPEAYIDYGKSNLEKGVHFLELNLSPPNLVEETGSFSISAEKSVFKKKITINPPKDPEALYLLSFDYKLDFGQTRVFMETNSDWAFPTGLMHRVFDTLDLADSGRWSHFESAFTPFYGTTEASLNLWLAKRRGANRADLEIKNLSLSKIAEPTIIFVKNKEKSILAPDVAFREINPNEYLIDIDGARTPFLLAFNQSYDSGWKIYAEPEHIGSNIGGPDFLRSLDFRGILSTLKKKSLEPVFHGQINGFGNSWLINKSGDYSLRLVYQPQAYFLVGLSLSILGLIFLLALILYSIKKNL